MAAPFSMASQSPIAIKGKKKTDVKLGDGAELHYSPKAGYYAGPAAKIAKAELQGSIAPLLEAQKLAGQQFGAQRAQTQGFALAANKALGAIGPQVQAGYGQAAAQTQALGEGFSGSMREALDADQAQAAQYAEALGQRAPAQVDSAGFGNALKYGNSFIPSQSIIAQGAHANQWSRGQGAVGLASGRQEMLSVNNAENEAAAKSASQIATIAAKYPSLFSAAEHDLIKQAQDTHKLQAADRKAAVDEEYKTATLENDQHQQLTRDWIAEQDANYDLLNLQQKVAYNTDSIAVRSRANTIAMKNATIRGAEVDLAGTKATGYVKFKDGSFLKDTKGKMVKADPRIYTARSQSGSPKAVLGKMVKDARASLGKPVNNTSGLGGPYVLANGLKAGKGEEASRPGFPASTSDPKRAEQTVTKTFVEMVNAFVDQYGVSRALARKALLAGGWVPDGKRSSKKKTTSRLGDYGGN